MKEQEEKFPLIHVMEDDPVYMNLILKNLATNGYHNVRSFINPEIFIEKLNEKPDIVILDYNLGDYNGIQLLKWIKKEHPDAYVIMLTSQETVKVAVESLKHGAFDYIQKNDLAFIILNVLIKTIINLAEEEKNEKSANQNNDFHGFKGFLRD